MSAPGRIPGDLSPEKEVELEESVAAWKDIPSHLTQDCLAAIHALRGEVKRWQGASAQADRDADEALKSRDLARGLLAGCKEAFASLEAEHKRMVNDAAEINHDMSARYEAALRDLLGICDSCVPQYHESDRAKLDAARKLVRP